MPIPFVRAQVARLNAHNFVCRPQPSHDAICGHHDNCGLGFGFRADLVVNTHLRASSALAACFDQALFGLDVSVVVRVRNLEPLASPIREITARLGRRRV